MTNETKHTPGPWDIREMGDANQYCILRENDTKWLIGFFQNGEIWTNEQAANARLIAAAPELLEALTELLAVVNGECPHLLDEDRGGDARLSIAIDEIIAKAKGK